MYFWYFHIYIFNIVKLAFLFRDRDQSVIPSLYLDRSFERRGPSVPMRSQAFSVFNRSLAFYYTLECLRTLRTQLKVIKLKGRLR